MSEVPTSLPATAATGVRDVGELFITGASFAIVGGREVSNGDSVHTTVTPNVREPPTDMSTQNAPQNGRSNSSYNPPSQHVAVQRRGLSVLDQRNCKLQKVGG